MKPIEDFFFGGLYFFAKRQICLFRKATRQKSIKPRALRKEISKSFFENVRFDLLPRLPDRGQQKIALGKKVTP